LKLDSAGKQGLIKRFGITNEFFTLVPGVQMSTVQFFLLSPGVLGLASLEKMHPRSLIPSAERGRIFGVLNSSGISEFFSIPNIWNL
jgi:hypothetical protein